MSIFNNQTAHQTHRRDFLKQAAATTAALALPFAARAEYLQTPSASQCLFIHLTGGPSQIDTWDPKPNAPSTMRGPFQPIRTSLPGLYISEGFPNLAKRAHHVAWVRSVYHDEAPIHETGQQLIQTGLVSEPGPEYPHVAAIAGRSVTATPSRLHHVILPGPLNNTGVRIGHGQSCGSLGDAWQPQFGFPDRLLLGQNQTIQRDRFGAHPFGESCWQACQLIESGVPWVTINMFTTVFDQMTWDCHADGALLATTIEQCGTCLAPMFDQAFAALLDTLNERGLLESTLVVATGEFGRTPVINRRGGRDHWTGVWSALFAGGGVQGGRVIGASDRWGGEPKDLPIHASRLAATQLHAMGINPESWMHLVGVPTDDKILHGPILELF